MRIPSRFVETNAFWCTGDDPMSTRFTQLRDAGLDGVLVSVNPYLLEYVPFERTQRAARFFDASCHDAMTRNWQVHVNTDCNCIPGFCRGISLGDARTLDALCADGLDLMDCPILDALVENLGRLYAFAAAEFDYRPLPTGYISKLHLCLDIRRCIAQRTDAYAVLQPREFYLHL